MIEIKANTPGKNKAEPGDVITVRNSYYLIVNPENYLDRGSWDFVAICLSANPPYLTRVSEQGDTIVYKKLKIELETV